MSGEWVRTEKCEGVWDGVEYGGWWECRVCGKRGVRVERMKVGEEVWWVCEECLRRVYIGERR